MLHSGVAQAEYSRKGARGGIVKREPVENVHPLVRRHPVTGEKALFINRQFSRKIIGLKEEESNAILELLYSHIEKGADFQTRLRWKPRTVVLWDSTLVHRLMSIGADTYHRSRHCTLCCSRLRKDFGSSTWSPAHAAGRAACALGVRADEQDKREASGNLWQISLSETLITGVIFLRIKLRLQ